MEEHLQTSMEVWVDNNNNIFSMPFQNNQARYLVQLLVYSIYDPILVSRNREPFRLEHRCEEGLASIRVRQLAWVFGLGAMPRWRLEPVLDPLNLGVPFSAVTIT